MADDPTPLPVYEIHWLRLFPWLRIFRAPGSAADSKKLVLCMLGLFLMWAGWQSLDLIFPSSSGITPEVFEPREPIGPDTLSMVPWWLTEPARLLTAPFFATLDESSENGRGAFLHAILAAVWTLIVWGLIGGAVARIAVVEIFKGERVELWDAIHFARRKAVPLVGSPLISVLGIILVAAFLAGFGLLYRIPKGPVAAGALAFLPLAGGLILALIVIGLAVSWPLMPASVAAEAEDGFDALSRSYAYVKQRPWNLLWYVAVAFTAGSVGLVFVDVFAHLVVHLAAWGLSFGGPVKVVNALYRGEEPDVSSTVLQLHAFWLGVVATLVRAWIYSMFWTSAGVIYVLLRKDVDGKPYSMIAMDPMREAAEKAKSVPTPAGSSAARSPHSKLGAEEADTIGQGE